MEQSGPGSDGYDVAPLIEKILDPYEATGRDRLSALRDVLGVESETDEEWVERLERTATELETDPFEP